jgi:hypothetical protein
MFFRDWLLRHPPISVLLVVALLFLLMGLFPGSQRPPGPTRIQETSRMDPGTVVPGTLDMWWQWLRDLSPGQATFLGWPIGFATLVGGALLNAHFNRRRDDRLRREEQRSVAIALRAELAGIHRTADAITETTFKPGQRVHVADLGHSIQIMPHMIPKLGLLDQETIESVINVYILLKEYRECLLFLHDEENSLPQRGLFLPVSPANVPQYVESNTILAEAAEEAIDKLDTFLRRTK